MGQWYRGRGFICTVEQVPYQSQPVLRRPGGWILHSQVHDIICSPGCFSSTAAGYEAIRCCVCPAICPRKMPAAPLPSCHPLCCLWSRLPLPHTYFYRGMVRPSAQAYLRLVRNGPRGQSRPVRPPFCHLPRYGGVFCLFFFLFLPLQLKHMAS
jgi:hypothetical protein